MTERFSTRNYQLRAGHRFYRQLGDEWKRILRSNYARHDDQGCSDLARYLRASGADPATAVTRTIALATAVIGRA